MKPVELIIVGAGSRGWIYSDYARRHPELARVVAVAEPRDYFRDRMASAFGLSRDRVFSDWSEIAGREKFADAAIIATPDHCHAGPATAMAAKGYALLLEKPMATNAAECRRIVEAVEKHGVMMGVCHVLRYTRLTQTIKGIIDSGRLGDVIAIQHLEPVGYWHQAHSFVRGNWRREDQSSPMLLAKSCHDLDWLCYVMGGRCERASSFGSLTHLCQAGRPAGAGDRCVQCGVEGQCPYSAKRIYLGRAARGEFGWPVDVITEDLTMSGVERALREGPYGRCVYASDNDVVDHQAVILEFDRGRTAEFTMTAFTEGNLHRQTRIFGTRGELKTDGVRIDVFDFLTENREVIDVEAGAGSIVGGHGGGDYAIMKSFVAAVRDNDASRILSGPRETLMSHLAVFAAEQARRERKVVSI